MPRPLQWLWAALRRRWRAHLLNLLMLLAVLAGVHWWQTRHLPSGPMPNLALELANGERTTLHEWQARHPGRAVALHIWAQWCPICRAEESSITRLQADHPVLTIAMQSGSAAEVQKLLHTRGLPWATAIDAQGDIALGLGVHAVPVFMAIDPQGRITGTSVGYTSEWAMRARLWWARL